MTTSTPKKFAVLLKPRPSQPALDRAAQYARMNPDFEIVAVRIVNEYAETDDKDQIKIKEESDFERIRRSYSVDNISFKLIFNHDVAEGFIKECSEGGYDLAVISANKRNAIKDLFISNIDSTIMRKSEIPVLVVREAAGQSVLGGAVVLAIDFLEVAHSKKLDEILFESASSFAKSFDGELHVANCIVPHNAGRMQGNISESRIVGGGIASPQDVTNKLAEEFSKKHGVPLDHVHVLQGRVDEEIPRLCKKLSARMVCMGTTPRSSFFGSVNSSASELVLDQIHGDVFIVNAATLK